MTFERKAATTKVKLPNNTGTLEYYQDFVRDRKCLFDYLESHLPWTEQPIKMFGKEHLQPRLICSFSTSPEITYTYSKQLQIPASMQGHEPVMLLRHEIERALSMEPGYFNLVLCNLYRNGEDYMGYHADNEPELGPDPVIASVSLGSERDFLVKQRQSTNYKFSEEAEKATLKYLLHDGSLLVMKDGMQTHWLHSIPKRKRITEPRVNLTFRRIIKTK